MMPPSPELHVPLGYRMPAEWEPHDGILLAWPHNPHTWPGHLDSAKEFFLDLISAIAADETAFVMVTDADMQHEASARLLDRGCPPGVQWLIIPTNDAWCRDYGPTVLTRALDQGAGPPRLAIQWGYNAWGGKYPPFDLDQTVARRFADRWGLPCVPVDVVLEGGAIDVNGLGAVMTTASCLLNPNRNPDWDRPQMEAVLRRVLGVDEVLWLQGELEGDDTDGHIDNLARFTGPWEVVVVVDDLLGDHWGLQANRAYLQQWRSHTGQRLTVRELPLPEPVYDGNHRLPASYANFLITNRSVLVPQYHCPQDEIAWNVLADCFPGREIKGIDCTAAIRGLGAIHCLTQQIPSAPGLTPSSSELGKIPS